MYWLTRIVSVYVCSVLPCVGAVGRGATQPDIGGSAVHVALIWLIIDNSNSRLIKKTAVTFQYNYKELSGILND